MNRIQERLARLKDSGRTGIMTHVVAGYPSLATSERLVRAMDGEGVDFIEIQIPFSDPVADGPVIMEANDCALRSGTTLADCFALVRRTAPQISAPLFFMCYFNTAHHYGVERFCRAAHAAGAAGVIVPDMPIDEEPYEHLARAAKQYGLSHITVLSPSTTEERLALNARDAHDFAYVTARAGTTGTHAGMDPKLRAHLTRIRHALRAPIAVGFGIASAEHVRMLRGYADIAVVGSAVLSRLSGDNIVPAIALVRQLVRAARP